MNIATWTLLCVLSASFITSGTAASVRDIRYDEIDIDSKVKTADPESTTITATEGESTDTESTTITATEGESTYPESTTDSSNTDSTGNATAEATTFPPTTLNPALCNPQPPANFASTGTRPTSISFKWDPALDAENQTDCTNIEVVYELRCSRPTSSEGRDLLMVPAWFRDMFVSSFHSRPSVRADPGYCRECPADTWCGCEVNSTVGSVGDLSSSTDYHCEVRAKMDNWGGPSETNVRTAKKEEDDGLSGGAIAGIVIGSLAAVALVGAVIYLFIIRQ